MTLISCRERRYCEKLILQRHLRASACVHAAQCTDFNVYLLAPSFRSALSLLLEDLPHHKEYEAGALAETLELLAEKMEGSDLTHVSWLAVLLRNSLARWEGHQEVAAGIRAVLSVLQGMGINELRE